MIQYYSVNGKFVPAREAQLKVNDLSIIRGYGVFDYFLFKRGIPLFLEDYLQRFYASAKLMELEIPVELPTFKESIFKLISLNGVEEGGIRLLLTGGYANDGYTPISPNWMILQYPLPSIPKEKYEKGVKLLKTSIHP